MTDFVKEVTEIFWGESTLEMGFVKFVLTFVSIYVVIKAYGHIIEGGK
jgi:hypothetical protein